MFEAPVFTNAGRRLLNRAIAGENLIFTSIKMGRGEIDSSDDIASMTDLIDPVIALDIHKVKAEEETATITATFSNKDFSQGFLFKELGLFAKDPDGGEDILYCYQNAYDTAEYIAASTSEMIEKQISIISIVGNAEHVSATIDDSLVYVTWQDLEEYVDSSPKFFVQEEEPSVNNCLWIKPINADITDPETDPETVMLELSDDLEASDYYAEIDGNLKAIENVVDSESELTDSSYMFDFT